MRLFDDFLPDQPYLTEARRRVKQFREENQAQLIDSGEVADRDIAQLMADYAAEVWQEGYDDGHTEGYDEGYAAKENEFDDD